MSTILILDDEQTVRDIAVRALAAAGHDVIATGSPDEALAAAEAGEGAIHLFITNHVLPDGRTGREVAEALRASRPDLLVLHISGFPERTLRAEESLTPGGFYLGKPFYPKDFVAKVNQILATRAP
jgi:DNA-binding response OmpR family regulator